MKLRLVRLLLASSVLLGCMALFVLGDAIAASASTTGNSCAVQLTGTLPTSYTVDPLAVGYNIECSGWTSGEAYVQMNVVYDGIVYVLNMAQISGSLGPSFSVSFVAGGPTTQYFAGVDFSAPVLYAVSGTGAFPTSMYNPFDPSTPTVDQTYAYQSGSYDFDYATVTLSEAFGVVPPPPPAAPCTLNSFQGPSDIPTSDGVTPYLYTIGYGGVDTARIVAVDQAGITGGAYTTSPDVTYDGKSFPTESIEWNSGQIAYGISVDPVAASIIWNNGDTIDPDFWCDEGGGTWVDWGPVTSLNTSGYAPGGTGEQAGTAPCLYGGQYDEGYLVCTGPPASTPSGSGSTDGGPFALSSCFTSQGMSLYNPVSWVTGAVRFGACVMQWLFEPSPNVLSSLEKNFGITSNAPTGTDPASQWLGAMAKGVTAYPFAEVADIQTVADGGGCSLSVLNDADTLGGHSTSACTILTSLSSLPAAATGDITWLQVVLSAIIYVFAALLLFHFIKRAIDQ